MDINLYERCYLKWSCIASYINIISFLLSSYFILHSCPMFDAVLKFKWKKCLKLMLMYCWFNLLPPASTSKFSVFSIFQGLLLTSNLFRGENLRYVHCCRLSISAQVVLAFWQCHRVQLNNTEQLWTVEKSVRLQSFRDNCLDPLFLFFFHSVLSPFFHSNVWL